MHFKDRYYLVKKLCEIVEEMNNELDFIIVEGRKDKKVLRILGFRKKILFANSRARADGKYSILTDFDEEGRKIAKILTKKYGEKNLVKIYRKKFYELLKEFGISQIEAIQKSIEMSQF